MRVGYGLEGDCVIAGHRYPLAVLAPPSNPRGTPGPAFWREGSDEDQEQSVTAFAPNRPAGTIVTAQWFIGRKRGQARSFSSRRSGLGVHYAGWDDSLDNFLRQLPTRYEVTPANAPTDVPTFMFEEDISSTLNYYFQQRYTWRVTINASTHAMTVVNITDQGASAVAGPMARWLGRWYIPLGASVDFVELTTPSSNTFTAASGSMRSLAFSTTMDSLTPKLARAYSVNQVALAATGPLTAANWASGFSVGGTDGTIKALAESGVFLFVGKDDNLYAFVSSTGVTQPLLNISGGKAVSRSGLGTIALPSTELVVYNHSSGFHLAEGTSMLMGRGLDGMPTMTDVPGLTLEPYRADIYETAAEGNWVAHVARVVSGASTRSFVFIGDIRTLMGAPDNFVWHCVAVEDSWIRGLKITSTKMLLYTYNGKLAHRQLGSDGSPDAGPAAPGRGNASTTSIIVGEATDYGLSFHTKQLREARVLTQGAHSSIPLQIKVMRDGGSEENVGATVETDGTNGVTSRFLTSGSSDQHTRIQPVLSTTTTAGYDPTLRDLRVMGLELDAMVLPDRAGWYRIICRPGLPYSSGVDPLYDAKTGRDRLLALEGAADVLAVDADGQSIRLHVVQALDRGAHLWANGIFYEVELIGRERRTS